MNDTKNDMRNKTIKKKDFHDLGRNDGTGPGKQPAPYAPARVREAV